MCTRRGEKHLEEYTYHSFLVLDPFTSNGCRSHDWCGVDSLTHDAPASALLEICTPWTANSFSTMQSGYTDGKPRCRLSFPATRLLSTSLSLSNQDVAASSLVHQRGSSIHCHLLILIILADLRRRSLPDFWSSWLHVSKCVSFCPDPVSAHQSQPGSRAQCSCGVTT
jgi:hypothetical protein